MEDAIRETGAELEIGHEIAPESFRYAAPASSVRFRKNRFRGQIRGAERVVQAFAGDGIHQTRGIADRHPAVARHAVLLPRGRFEAGQQMAVERRAVLRKPLLLHVALEPRAQGRSRFAFAADTDGKMPAARENPDVTGEAGKKLNVDAVAARQERNIRARSWRRWSRAPCRSRATDCGRPSPAMQKSASKRAILRAQIPSRARSLDVQNARLLQLRARRVARDRAASRSGRSGNRSEIG